MKFSPFAFYIITKENVLNHEGKWETVSAMIKVPLPLLLLSRRLEKGEKNFQGKGLRGGITRFAYLMRTSKAFSVSEKRIERERNRGRKDVMKNLIARANWDVETARGWIGDGQGVESLFRKENSRVGWI